MRLKSRIRRFILALIFSALATIQFAFAQYTKLMDFATIANGFQPTGSLITDGTFLYGMAAGGGLNNKGVIFKIAKDGTGYTRLLDFDGSSSGQFPGGSLIFDGTFLYGMTYSGGANNLGTIVKIKPDGTGFVKLFDFDGAPGGGNPRGTLVSDGTFLFGMTSSGGSNNFGTIFKIMPDGSGFVKLLDFAGALNGREPFGALISTGTFLFGMTSRGGTSNLGTVFKIMPDGSSYTKLLDFTGATNGRDPFGDLYFDGTFLYGMANGGGANNSGVLFKLMPDGTNFSKLRDFGADGDFPSGTVIPFGGFLYGMTDHGGVNTVGTIFKIRPDGTGYSTLFDFSNSSGRSPYGSLLLDGSNLFGLTTLGATNNFGAIFKYLVSSLTPTITDFTPLSGPVGASVTITGTNFNSTPTNNIVYFGATRANVTAATTTQLTVTVPTGATYEPISVTIDALSAYSSRPFITTFPTTGVFTSCSFDPKVDFATGSTPLGISTADFDGDGNVDIAIGNRVSRTIGLYLNTSTAGQINAATFAAPITLVTPFGDPYKIRSADVDGDGKIDIVSTVAGLGLISVYRNTSTVGALSFDGFVNFTAGADPVHLEIMDIDGDGKPEIVIANRFSNSISIYRNTSSIGGLNASSFAPKIDFSIGIEPYLVTIGDLNSDGKPDIVASASLSNTISIFQNTATTGVINSSSLAVPVVLSTGAFPVGIALSDLDGDGLTDIALVNSTPKTVSVFRSIASGTITSASFQPSVDFSVGNDPADVIASDFDGDGKVDLVTGNTSAASISLLRNTATPGVIDATSFASKIDLTSGNLPAQIKIADMDGDGKSDLVVSNMNSNTFSVFRKLADAPAPTITSFTPLSGTPGGTVVITGANFSATPANNVVRFNGIIATVTSSTTTSIEVAIPIGATTGTISVSVGCPTATSISSFNVCAFSAPGVTPGSGCSNTSISLSAAGGSSGQYRWYTAAIGGLAIAGETNPAFSSPLIATTTTYFVAINDGTCESSRVPVIATVIPLPASPSAISALGCLPSAILSLAASGASDGDYRWYTSAAGSSLPGQVNGAFLTPSISVSTTYYVSIHDGTCESVKTPVTAQIRSCDPLIATSVIFAPAGGSASTDVSVLVTTIDSPLDAGSIRVVGQPTSGAFATMTGGMLSIDYTGISFAGTEQITIEVCDMTGHCAQQVITIEVSGDVIIFNALSPNGDGQNEIFRLQYINVIPDTKNNSVKIFDRNGSVVFETQNYDNENQVFKGQDKNGHDLPPGTYYYKIAFDSGKEPQAGFISLKR